VSLLEVFQKGKLRQSGEVGQSCPALFVDSDATSHRCFADSILRVDDVERRFRRTGTVIFLAVFLCRQFDSEAETTTTEM